MSSKSIPLFSDTSVKEEEGNFEDDLPQGADTHEVSGLSNWEQEMEMDLLDPDAVERPLVEKPVAPKVADARSARADFVFDLVNLYLSKIKEKEAMRSGDRSVNMDHCRRSLSFSSERNQMWTKVTERTNGRFGEALGETNVEQIKKIYGNRLARPKKHHIPSRPEELLASGPFVPETISLAMLKADRRETTPQETPTPPKKIKLADSSTPSTSSADRVQAILNQNNPTSGDTMDSLLKAFDRSDEITGLREQLIEKDREIERLKRLILKMSDSHLKREEAAMEMFMKALRDETAQELINAFQKQ